MLTWPPPRFHGTRDILSRFENSISWLAAVGNQAALAVFDHFGFEAIYARNRELATKLRVALDHAGWHPIELPEPNRSTIVSVPIGDLQPSRLLGALSQQKVICSVRMDTFESRSISTTTKTTLSD